MRQEAQWPEVLLLPLCSIQRAGPSTHARHREQVGRAGAGALRAHQTAATGLRVVRRHTARVITERAEELTDADRRASAPAFKPARAAGQAAEPSPARRD